MASSSKKNLFVKIQIGLSESKTSREIGLTRLQFEILILLIPVVFLWGVGSTAVLIKTLFIDRPKTTEVSSAAADALPVTKRDLKANEALTMPLNRHAENQTLGSPERTSTTLKKDTNRTDTAVVASRSFKVDDIFSIGFSIAKKPGDNGYSAMISMSNLQSKADSGRYWFSVLALTKSDEKIWLTPMPEVRITSAGEAQNPERGRIYAFQNFRKSEFALPKQGHDIVRFEEVIVGFYRDDSTATISKAKLISNDTAVK